MQSTICTLNEKQEKQEFIVTQEHEKAINNLQALFPLLQDAIYEINPDKIHDLIKEKHQTTYYSDYKSHDVNYNIIGIKKKTIAMMSQLDAIKGSS